MDIPTTRPSLLCNLNGRNSELAWQEFDQIYRPLLSLWAKRGALELHEAEDLLAHIYLHLLPRLRTFAYTPDLHFRGWLKMAVRSAVGDFYRSKAKQLGRPVDGHALEEIFSQEESEELESEFEECFASMMEQGWRIVESVRQKVSPLNWQIFYESYVMERDSDEIATELGVAKGQIYVARCRVKGILRREADRVRSLI